jgi:cobalt-zinc-cadmium efflux system protein
MKQENRPKRAKLSNIHEYKGATKNRLVLSMIITASVMVIEVIGSVLAGSLALASDAGHMLTHLFALAVSFAAIHIACKEPCHHRTFGYYRAEILAALFNSIFLFAVTAFIFYEGIVRLLNPQPVLGFEMLLVAFAGLVANGLSLLILRKSMRNDLNVRGAFLHMFADAASSVAIIIGAIIVTYTDWYFIDPLLGIGISILIFVWAYGLLKDSVNVLLETAPKGINTEIVSAQIKESIPEVISINNMHIWEITSGMYSLTAHIEADLTSDNLKEIIYKINNLLADKFSIKHTTLQIEPKTE